MLTKDQKIGLALSILLIGAVAAFFFRHEEPVVAALPPLKLADELDREIASQPHAPYLSSAAPTASQAEPITANADNIGPDQPGGLVPEPIALEGEMAESTTLASLPSPTTPAATGEGFHTVQRGETLSSIAAQYLGSANRYDEVFQANTDRLRSVHDLRVGQEIRIPAAHTGTTSSRPAPRPRADSDDEIASAPVRLIAPNDELAPESIPQTTPSGKRFVPFRGSPLTPGTPRIATPVKQAEAARKSLSQLPPGEDTVFR